MRTLNVILAGPGGCGKSFAAHVIAKALKDNGFSVPHDPIFGSDPLPYYEVDEWRKVKILEESDSRIQADVKEPLYPAIIVENIISATGARRSR